jgi:glycerol uptake facilitator-like aquaporin
MENDSPPGSPGGNNSLTSNQMTMKQYILVNLSKFIVEMAGTAVMGVFYLTVGDQQAGMLLGFWIITLFGVAVSGSHFNPAVTLVIMFRKNSTFGSRRLLGIMYIVA